ncbi:hypothetical protein BC828DRAFT_16320 [Blastocladiella britannica]|nr:hypothetical protein BC828DRAFT_16320 [Blastocladiella britannica]
MTCDLQSWYLSHGNTLNVRMSPQSLSLVIIQLPFVKPDSIDERVLRDGMVSQKTRCEVMHTMLRFGLVLATILHDIAAGNNHGLAESDDGISANPSAISKSGDAPNSLHVEDKLGWLLVLLLEELSSNLPLTGALLGILHSLTEQVQTLDIAELAATCAQLESAMVPKFNRPGPPLAIQPELVPSLIDAVANPSHEHASKLINAQELKFAKNLVEQDVTLATLEGVWLQLDSETDRLVMPSQVGTQEQALDETLISCAPGIFELSYNCITWLGLERDASPATAAYTPALVLFFPLIKNYSLGRVVDATTLPYASHTLHTVDLKRREETAMIKAFYINIVTQDQSFRFYPIYDTEIHKVVDMISTATGLLPFKEPQYIRHTVARRLQVTRNAILDHLVERGRIGALHVPTAAGAMAGGAGSSAAAGAGGAAASSRSPWIEHSAELIRVLRKLTEEREAQALYDIERLYHSCRIEFEVTKETIHHLRLIWHNSQSETVRLKVLAIVDRILDRAVMREGDSNFIMLYRWLRHLEETVSPYKRCVFTIVFFFSVGSDDKMI